MHMADALLSPTVSGVMYAATTVVAGVSVYKIKAEEKQNENYNKIPLMAVMSALVFAGQMINYTIPGTGSSGHISGGFLLSALLGPWAGFLSMLVVLAIQSIFFADGGLLSLGANVWNMAFYGCFIGYFLIYKPTMRSGLNTKIKLIISSILGCVITLQLGSFSVVCETVLSGITELPFGKFCLIMQPIHLAIGLVEGLITGAVLVFINEARPELLQANISNSKAKFSYKKIVVIIAIVALLTGGIFSLFASQNPDGLEWSLFGNIQNGYQQNMGLDEENYGLNGNTYDFTEKLQQKFAFLPDYSFKQNSENSIGTSISGVVGVVIVGTTVCLIGKIYKKKKEKQVK